MGSSQCVEMTAILQLGFASATVAEHSAQILGCAHDAQGDLARSIQQPA
jgi:hypothetical protein